MSRDKVVLEYEIDYDRYTFWVTRANIQKTAELLEVPVELLEPLLVESEEVGNHHVRYFTGKSHDEMRALWLQVNDPRSRVGSNQEG